MNNNNFVLLNDVVSDIILEIRYYTSFNFVGTKINGYNEPLALITKEAANALKNANKKLLNTSYRIKIYDAYRPTTAVEHFKNWAKDLNDIKMKEIFYPEVDKKLLFEKGYIAEKSSHSRGSAIDLTLFNIKEQKDIDMGSNFDYFGDISSPNYTKISDIQLKNRMFLRNLMIKSGFLPYENEWWHFTLKDEPYPNTYFSFPVGL